MMFHPTPDRKFPEIQTAVIGQMESAPSCPLPLFDNKTWPRPSFEPSV